MEWTDKKPEKDGLYWLREAGGAHMGLPSIVEVSGDTVWMFGDERKLSKMYSLERAWGGYQLWHWMWYGPLEVPSWD